MAKTHGSRVILCSTHEPPNSIGSAVEAKHAGARPELPVMSPLSASSTEETYANESMVEDPAATVYVRNVTRGELCAFVLGYFTFLPEINGSVHSVLSFMPGMRIIWFCSWNVFFSYANAVCNFSFWFAYTSDKRGYVDLSKILKLNQHA